MYIRKQRETERKMISEVKKVLGIFLAVVMVLGVAMPQVTSVVYGADLLASDLAYEHNLGQENKTITEADGTTHDVFCINPNIAASSNLGNDSDKRDKYTADAIIHALNYNTNAGSSRMRGTQEDQDVLASIIIYGREQGKTYKEIQDAVADAVQNAEGARPYNSLVDYAYANRLSSDEYELYVYGHKSEPSAYQTLIDAVRVTPPTICTTVSVEGKGSASADAPLEIELAEGEESLANATVIDNVTYENLPAGNYDVKMEIVDENGNVVAERDGNFTASSTSGTVPASETTKWGVTLKPGKYAVNITLTNTGTGKTRKHNGLEDKAEQIVVKTVSPSNDQPTEKEGKLSTTVEVDGKKASSEAPLEIAAEAGADSVTKNVVDNIDYSGLNKGSTYKVSGTLVEIEDGKVVNDNVATATAECVAEDESGTWQITFENVTLKVGKTYVVFEEAVEVKDANNNDVTNGKVIEHKDENDKAQTVVVKETPKEEEKPKEDPKEEVPPTEDNNNPPPQLPSTGQPTTPSNTTPSNTTPPPQLPSTGNPTVPATGDEANMILWMGLALVAAITSVVIRFVKRAR